MTTAEDTIYSALSADSAVVAIVEDRIYKFEMLQASELPALEIVRVSTRPHVELYEDGGCANVTVQINCVCSGSGAGAAVAALAQAVRAALKRIATFVGEEHIPVPEREIKQTALDFNVHEEIEL